MRERHPGIKVDHKKHLKKCLEAEEKLHQEVVRRHKDWPADEVKEEFRKCIDTLTGVHSKQQAMESRQNSNTFIKQ